jgi:putative endonuclease
MNQKQYAVYILECRDRTYYTGYTDQLIKRLARHNGKRGAKYTRSRTPVRLMHYEVFDSKSEALKREYQIKQLTRRQKEELIWRDMMGR